MQGTFVSRVLALTILAVSIAALTKTLVLPLAERLQTASDQLFQQRMLLGRLIAQAAAAAPSVTTPDINEAELRTLFLPGDSDAGRLASLQSRVDSIAQKSGARLASTQVMKPAESKGLRLLGIQTQFSANLDQLQQILFELETQKPYLVIESLHITRAADAGTIDRPDLDVRVSIKGAADRKKS